MPGLTFQLVVPDTMTLETGLTTGSEFYYGGGTGVIYVAGSGWALTTTPDPYEFFLKVSGIKAAMVTIGGGVFYNSSTLQVGLWKTNMVLMLMEMAA
jgi:hypothetical protein